MQQVQLYIQGQRVELFDDEIISLTQSIQNIKDPATIFTGFTQEFSLPATRETNKLFEHYYNFDIIQGYDGRIKTPARIELNSKTFQEGKIRLQSVEMKDNVAYAYKVVFIGNLVELKDAISEDELSDLIWLDNFEKVFSMDVMKASLSDSTGSMTVDGTTYTNVMRTALISPTKRLYYDTGTNINGDGNLHYHSTGQKHGVLWSDLKFSLGVPMIIKAIEIQYGITFSEDFLGKGNNLGRFDDLFMYMHRKQGVAQPETTLPSSFTILPSSFSATYGLLSSFSSLGSGCLCPDKNGVNFSANINSRDDGFEVEQITGIFGGGNGIGLLWGFSVDARPQTSDAAKIYTLEIYYTPVGGTEELTPSYTQTSDGTSTNSVSIHYLAGNNHTHATHYGYFRVQLVCDEPITFPAGNMTMRAGIRWTNGTDSRTTGSQTNSSGAICQDSRSLCTPNCFAMLESDNSEIEGALIQFAWKPTQQLPKMKVIDFLTGIFRLFNLTAYYEGDIVKVEPLDEFYGVSTIGYQFSNFSTPTGWSYDIYTGFTGANASTTAVDNDFFKNPDKYQLNFQIDNYSAGTVRFSTETDQSAEFSGDGIYSVVLDATTTKLEVTGTGFTGYLGTYVSVKNYSDASIVYDISEYIDVSGGTVSNGLPYKQIDMRFKGHGSLFAKKFEQIFNRRFGDLEYSGDLTQTNNWAGSIYKLEVPFEKCVYERLFDGNTINQTDLQIGNMIDDSFNPYIGEPLLHYMNYKTGAPYAFLETSDDVVQRTAYNAPLNSVGTASNAFSINFNAEFSEWNSAALQTSTLFRRYYQNYMQDVFNKQRRITSVKAWLPLKILLNYNLGDRFKINQNLYRINSITTNLQSGESDIELLNEV
jgi:hypothetical protein